MTIGFAIPVAIHQGFDWPAWITAIATGMLVLGVLIAVCQVALATGQLREVQKSRHAQMALDMARHWDADEMVKIKQLARHLDHDRQMIQDFRESKRRTNLRIGSFRQLLRTSMSTPSSWILGDRMGIDALLGALVVGYGGCGDR